jgi:putative ABC transport system permease protein
VALGARRWVIVRQLLVQSLVLAGLGGALGVLTAVWGIQFFSKLVPENLSQLQAISLDIRVLAFAVVVTLFTGVFFGTLLALQISPTRPGEVIGEAGRDNAGGRRARFVRSALVVSEVTLALVLLIGAGLLIRSFHRLMQVDPGFSSNNLLTMSTVLSTPQYRSPEGRRAFYDEMLRRVSEVPGVENAGMISFLPLSFSGMNFSFSVENHTLQSNADLPMAVYRVVSPRYFETMRIPLLRGRAFDAHDKQDSPAVMVVNSLLASRFWPNENPIGKRLKIGPPDSPNPWATVVGVVTDVRQAGFYGDQRMEMYATYQQDRRGFTAPRDLVVRTKGDPRLLAGPVREAIHSVDKDQPVFNVKTMDEVWSTTVSRERFQTLLLAIFAALALALACIGLYGVISYTVAQRTREIGVRMALGANRRDVLKLVFRQGLALTLMGTVLGLTVAFWVTRLISEMLFNVTSTDPITFVGVAVVLNVVALLACYIPARRAAKVDPLVALRYE